MPLDVQELTEPHGDPTPANRHIVLDAESRTFDLKLRELWRYRDLIFLFVHRDFVAQYKQTILGPAWHVIQPVMTTLIFTIVFGRIAKISTDGTPPFLFYLSGTVVWAYFAGLIQDTSTTFTANSHIFGKVYFPRIAVPVATLLSKLIGFGIQFLVLVAVLIWYRAHGVRISPTPWALLLPLLVVMMAALGLGLGIIVSAATVRYRDLAVVVGFGVQLFMYMSPVVYPLSSVPQAWRRLVLLNPVTAVLETFRRGLLGVGGVPVTALVASLAEIAFVLLIGVIFFNRVEKTFMDTI